MQAEREPILSSFFYATILSHDCLEQALAFALANRLQKPTLLATQLMDIFSTVMKHDKGIQHSIRLDIQVSNVLYVYIGVVHEVHLLYLWNLHCIMI